MAIRNKEIALSFAAAVFAWILSVVWIPSLRLTPYAYINGIATGLVLALICLHLGARRPFDARPDAFPAVTSFGLSASSWTVEAAALRSRCQYERSGYIHLPALLSGSLDALLDFVIRDFVKSWYSKISAGQSFPNEVDRTVRLALDNLANHLQDRDVVHVIVLRILPVVDDHLQKFVEAEHAVRGKTFEEDSKDVTEEQDIAIAAKFDGGKLHPAASVTGTNSESLQKQHLRDLVAGLLPHVLPAALLSSGSVFALVREIVSCAVLLPAMQLLTDPDFINQQIEAYGKAVLHERKSVRKLRAAIDEAASLNVPPGLASDFPHLSPNDSEKLFEQFIRAIRHCTVLHQARRIHLEIDAQIGAAQASPGQDVTYLRRLEIGRRLLEQRIEQLSDHAARTTSTNRLRDDAKKTSISMRDILYDTNGLSYLMEFMDRADKMIYVQFWIVIDGLRTPAERIFDNNIEEQHSWSEAERQIINKINNNYFWREELHISPGAQAAVNDFLEAGSDATGRQYNAARRAILNAQSDVLREMETNHFPSFKASELYEKSGFPIDTSEPSLASTDQKPPLAQTVTKSQTNLNSTSFLKAPDLRRAIASSSDIHAESRKLDTDSTPRRSLDDQAQRQPPRKPLFESADGDRDPLSRSFASIDSDLDSPLEIPSSKGALHGGTIRSSFSDLLDGGDDKDSLFDKRSMTSSQDLGSERGSIDIKRPGVPSERPTLSSLGLLGTPSKRTVFTSDDLFGENEQLWEDEEAATLANNADEDRKNDEDIKKAAPGDLGLAEMVQVLSVEINKLETQQGVIQSLLSKAELTNNVAELRILRKSEGSVVREIRRKEMQRQQYIVQESDNTLYGRASVSIKNIMVGTEQDGHEFALYVIEVSRGMDPAASSMQEAASWAIARRYSEFHDLHRRLRRKFPTLRDVEFPRRQMVLTLQKEFLKKRRVALEKYLRSLLRDADICRSLELRAFLSQQTIKPLQASPDEARMDRKDFVTRIYNSVSDGMEEFLGNVPIIDQLSTAGQNLISAATATPLGPLSPRIPETEVLESAPAFVPAAIANDPASAAEARRELSALEGLEMAQAASVKKETTFISPIASAFLTLFQLRTSTASAWLRGRAVIIVLQQLLGGTVERRVRESFTAATTAVQLSKYLEQIRGVVWPDGGPMAAKTARSRKDKDASQKEASVVLAAVLIDVAGGVIGRSVARDAGKRMARMIGNERILKGLGYRILDEFIEAVWEVKAK